MTQPTPVPTPPLSQDQEILIALRRTLTTIVRELTPAPGMPHPLREATIEDVRHCLFLISARERELAQLQGRGGERPQYADQPGNVELVPMAGLTRKPN